MHANAAIIGAFGVAKVNGKIQNFNVDYCSKAMNLGSYVCCRGPAVVVAMARAVREVVAWWQRWS